MTRPAAALALRVLAMESGVPLSVIDGGRLSADAALAVSRARTRLSSLPFFVLEARGGSLVGVDVKSSPSLQPGDAEGLRFLKELAGEDFKQGIVLYLGSAIEPLDSFTAQKFSCWLILRKASG